MKFCQATFMKSKNYIMDPRSGGKQKLPHWGKTLLLSRKMFYYKINGRRWILTSLTTSFRCSKTEVILVPCEKSRYKRRRVQYICPENLALCWSPKQMPPRLSSLSLSHTLSVFVCVCMYFLLPHHSFARTYFFAMDTWVADITVLCDTR